MKLVFCLLIILGSLIGETAAMDIAERQRVISAYGEFLESQESSIGRASDLPYTKEKIRTAIAEELQAPSDPSLINSLEIGYIELESFVSDEEYNGSTNFESVVNSDEGRQPTPADILSSSPEKHIDTQALIIKRQEKRLEEIKEFQNGRKQ
jgi:hypothetical protein